MEQKEDTGSAAVAPKGTTRRVALRLLAGAAALSGIGMLAACGSPSPSTPSSSSTSSAVATAAPPTPAATTSSSAAAAPTPNATAPVATAPAAVATSPSLATKPTPVGPSGNVVVLQGVDPNTLDPNFANGQPEKNVLLHIFDALLTREAQTMKLAPMLATSWKNIDPTTWEFTLATGAKFHNGEPVDAKAVQFSLDRTKDPNSTAGFVDQASYDSTQVVDDRTVRIKTTSPSPILPNLLVDVYILPPNYYNTTSPDVLQQKPVGSGPYVFKEWTKDDHITMQVNPNYWRTPATVQQVTFKPVPELSTRVAQLQSGDADVIVNVAPDQAKLLESGGSTRVSRVEGGRIIFVGMRSDSEHLSDKRVRQALNHAIDFDTINQQILGGIGKRAATLVNPPYQNPGLTAYPYDPAKAKSLLAEAGVDNGFSVVMDTTDGRYLKDKDIAQAVSQNLAAVGVNAEVKPQEWTVYINQMLFKQNTDPLYLLGLGSTFTGQEELTYVKEGYIADATHWQNTSYLQMYDQLTKTFDPTQRQDVMNKMQALVYDEAPVILLWHQVDIYGVSKRLKWESRADERINMYEASLT
jgi:peptide/nickel transport system substrate-binding protein